MTLTYTPRFHLAVPDFLSEPWHAEFAAAMESIDQALFTAIVAQETNQWLHDHVYIIGDLIIDPMTGTLYTCAVNHTSSNTIIAPTFADELAAHPTFWTSFAVIAASQLEAEQGTDNNKYMTPLRTAQAIIAQSPTPGIATVAQAQEGTNNTEIITPLRAHQAITARIATQAEATAGVNNTQLMTPLRTEQLIVSAGVAGGDAIGFSAHKNGTNQTGIASGVATKVTFGTELYDSGSFYDTANSRWTPPSGQIHIDAGIWLQSVSLGTPCYIRIYKNGALFRDSYQYVTNNTEVGIQISVDDIANGTDYYEVFASGTSAGTVTANGALTTSYFMGVFLGEVGVVTMGLAEIGFRASKSAAQPGIPNAVWTKITFPTEEYDQGSRYDPAISRWVPPTGLVHITAGMDAVGSIAVGGLVMIAIYKNGAALKSVVTTASSGSNCGAVVSTDDIASGTDYYEAFVYINSGGPVSIQGVPSQDYFTGHRVTGAQGETGPIGLTGPSGSTAAPAINSGRLRFVNATTLSFLPFNGAYIKINGVLVPIPSTGIVGLTNTHAFVNGVADQPLAANTLYYVYAFVNAGTLTADFSLTGHAMSTALTNEGTEIKTGDNTRTLIGMIRTSGVQFVDTPQARYVLSWFNRRSRSLRSATGTNTYAGASWTTLNGASYVFFLSWADEASDLGANCYGYINDTGAASFYMGFALEQLTAAGAGLQQYILFTQNVQWYCGGVARDTLELAEGHHSFYPAAYGGYTTYVNIILNGTIQG